MEHLEGLLLTEERMCLPNPTLEQSFDQLEDELFEVLHCWVLLDEEKIGGEIVVSLLKFMGSMVLWFCCNYDMVSKFCCWNSAATTHKFSGLSCCCYMLVFNAGNFAVCIPSFILFEKTNRGRMVWFYVLCCCCYTMVLSGFIMV